MSAGGNLRASDTAAMPSTEPIEVARRANELFSSIPFEELRGAIVGDLMGCRE